MLYGSKNDKVKKRKKKEKKSHGRVKRLEVVIYLRIKRKQKYIKKEVGDTTIRNKMRKTNLRWFDYVFRRPINTTLRKFDFLDVFKHLKG